MGVVRGAVGVGFALAAATASGPATLVAAVLVPAAALAISWNGLVFTAAGEFAPPGRAATAIRASARRWGRWRCSMPTA